MSFVLVTPGVDEVSGTYGDGRPGDLDNLADGFIEGSSDNLHDPWIPESGRPVSKPTRVEPGDCTVLIDEEDFRYNASGCVQ